ncbi:sensor histidine kinase [Pedobacter hiemivivus]|uniref:histidine kinase n=1 Tax=Pedobacter hiemivivus TaxID=2530454 RepID=A0A4V2MJ61_9SPHI|nr:HAMP domain-containing sensor histidine kinase [Pedobacter hiemivivus]TCC93066.1 PAS domain-containing sensor histidine kinase [Pedobacter hiemivivus]
MKKNTGREDQENTKFNPDESALFQLPDIPKLAIKAANIGTWFIDERTGTFLSSIRMKELHGYHPQEQPSFEALLAQIPKKYRQKVIRIMKEAKNRQETFYLEYPVIGFHDQQQRWLRVLGGSDQPSAGNKQFSGVIMDITDLKQIELRRNRFIGMVNHELKTPLTALKAYIQLLNKWAKQKKDGFTIGALSKLEKQVKKMTTMINGFLNFSGAESGKIHLTKMDFDMSKLLEEVIEEHSDISPEHVITLLPCEGRVVNADREKIEQVIINLISNAVKYSEPKKPIEVSCQQEKTKLKLNIKDTGIGIEQTDIDKLFKPHSRIKTSKTENISGFGIGLYVSAEIIKQHGGDIGVNSQPGQGSTFWFTLPVHG